MAHHQTGIAIVIKALLPTGKTIDENYEALSMVKQAHETGDYSAVLKAAQIDEIKAEQKTLRVEDAEPGGAQAATNATAKDTDDADVPEFLKNKQAA